MTVMEWRLTFSGLAASLGGLPLLFCQLALPSARLAASQGCSGSLLSPGAVT